MEQRQHRYLTEKLIKQPYFFLRWYKCHRCGRQFNFEEDKIYNKLINPKREVPAVKEYYDELTGHLKSIRYEKL